MPNRSWIMPGMPNDDNRDYLPEAIRGSDMVVNENGNNSLPYPERLTEYATLADDGERRVWYEYVPASYDGSADVPLVVSLHGGLMTGWGQAIYSSWTLVAERAGFIVLFPNASARKIWMVECERQTLEVLSRPNPEGFYMHIPPDDPDDNRDMAAVLSMIEAMKGKYRIDAGRIFLHGMSMGDIMASQLARHYGGMFAGQAGAAGIVWPEVLFDAQGEPRGRGGPIPVWHSRMEHDSVPFHEEETGAFVGLNRDYWRRVNGCAERPAIRIRGERNFAFYKGESADYVFLDVKNRDHGQTFDDAELVWDYFFSGMRRTPDGAIAGGETELPRQGDEYAVALAAGSRFALLNGNVAFMRGAAFSHDKLKYHGLQGGTIVRGSYLLAPLSFIAAALSAHYAAGEEGMTAELTLPDGRTLQFARGSIGCVREGRIVSMLCEAVWRDGEMYVSAQWAFQSLLNWHVSTCDGVLYATDHHAELSLNMARLLREEVLRDDEEGAGAQDEGPAKRSGTAEADAAETDAEETDAEETDATETDAAETGAASESPNTDAGTTAMDDKLRTLGQFMQARRSANYRELQPFAEPHGIVLLGDSITEGFPVHELLSSKRRIYNRGISGDTSAGVLDKLAHLAVGLSPSLIVLMIGTNDLGQGEAPEAIAGRIKSIGAALKEALPRTRIAVQSVLPVNDRAEPELPFPVVGSRTNEDIRRLNGLIAEAAAGLDIEYISQYDRLADADGRLRQAYTYDGLHLTIAGYAVLRAAIQELIDEGEGAGR
ncbi:GDSL-type esterase/lipase family protein [Cohnella rhizosphaerae]|uniref:GDSL-type esterase/lipase family protein n=1 Tax=Cohnella rhizosphaerae TaxID=1457232 RepID=A0A9X4KRF3_9BACL|nr:GDSL-type esterase/lipase family protein [Cohnella rhizosphaerae]MDG0808846.1 GDSL-type esterase/lipase family protein [Cohnella rhizosphaerae]